MKAEIKVGPYSPQLFGDTEIPENPSKCWLPVQADIGSNEEEGGDTFTFYICTPDTLKDLLGKERFVLGKHLIIVEMFDWKIVEDAISEICDSITGTNWMEIGQKLAQYGASEFEDYDPMNA